MKIEVKASDRIFEELGRNTYSYVDLLSELIDNSIGRWPGHKCPQTLCAPFIHSSIVDEWETAALNPARWLCAVHRVLSNERSLR